MPTPNTADAMKRYKAGNAGFTDKSHLKAKGLIPRADGTKKKSPQYESADTRELTNLLNKRTPLTPAEQKRKAELEKKLGVNEDAPANATGTAVAGTGDDSSTVVVKKKKKMQDKLMRRLGIKETLDRLVPDLEYTEDEITARKNKLKEMAVNAGKKLPQDPDVRKVKGTQPKKYYKTLSKADKDKRAAHFAKQDYKKSDDQDDYKPAPGDKEAKTKTSKFTKKFKQMYGEEILDEKIKGLENKAKKTGMPYSILKKVYDRGMAAWKGGHRPGTTQQQWAFARVNSFVTKSPGTWGKADSDLAKQVRGK